MGFMGLMGPIGTIIELIISRISLLIQSGRVPMTRPMMPGTERASR